MDFTSKCVVVPELPDDASEFTLKLYFSNVEVSGSGSVEEVAVEDKDGTRYAIVTFCDESVTQTVTSRVQKWGDQKLQVLNWDKWADLNTNSKCDDTAVKPIDTEPGCSVDEANVCNGEPGKSSRVDSENQEEEILDPSYQMEKKIDSSCDVPSCKAPEPPISDDLYVEPIGKPKTYADVSRNTAALTAPDSIFDSAYDTKYVRMKDVKKMVEDTKHNTSAVDTCGDTEMNRKRFAYDERTMNMTVGCIDGDREGDGPQQIHTSLSKPTQIIKYIEEMSMEFTAPINCEVRFKPNLKQIVFQGEESVVAKMKLDYINMVDKIESQKLSVSSVGKRFLENPEYMGKVMERIQSIDSKARLYICFGEYYIVVQTPMNGSNINMLVEQAQQCYSYKKEVPLSPGDDEFILSPKWDTMKAQYESQKIVHISVDTSIEIEGFGDDVELVYREIVKSMPKPKPDNSQESDTSGLVESNIKLLKGLYRLFDSLKQLVYNEVNEGDGAGKVQVEFFSDGKIPGVHLIKLKGPEAVVKQATQRVVQLKRRISEFYQKYSLPHHGSCIGYFCTQDAVGRRQIEEIEGTHMSKIEIRYSGLQSQGIERAGFRNLTFAVGEMHKPQVDPATTVTVTKGKIQEFSDADVVVNSVAHDHCNLDDCGVVAKAFKKAGGKDFEKEVAKLLPVKDGQVKPSSAHGKIKGKFVWQVGIRHWQGAESLHKLVNECFKLLKEYDFKSIAFPTLGCGNLKYPPYEVYRCIQEEASKHPDLKVYIVAFDDSLFKLFTDFTKGKRINPQNRYSQGAQPADCITFHVNALDGAKTAATIAAIKKLVSECIHEERIKDSKIKHLTPQIEKLGDKLVRIKIDANRVTVLGERKSVLQVTSKIKDLMENANGK